MTKLVIYIITNISYGENNFLEKLVTYSLKNIQ